VAYHDFGSDTGGLSYGSELDLRALFTTFCTFGVQVAVYREDGFSTDTSKIWIWTEYGF
jgi:hypothetical protein